MNGLQIIEPTIVLTFTSVPPSVNTLWRKNPRGGMYLSKQAVDFYGDVRFAIGKARVPSAWDYYDVSIVVCPRRRSGDVDNFIKPVLDSLTKAGFWDDDDRVARVSCEFGAIDKEGRTVVIVKPMPYKYKEG